MSYIFVIGEVLFDLLPQGKQPGGAPLNFAFHLNGLGNDVHFISRIGKDILGQELLEIMKEWNIDTRFIQIDHSHRTGEVPVSLDKNGTPQFKILEDRAFDYIEEPEFETLVVEAEPSIIYFGTLAQRSPVSRRTINSILKKLSGSCKVFLDLNLRAPYYNTLTIEQSLCHADIVKVSSDELEVLRKVFSDIGGKNEMDFVRCLQNKMKIDWICVTMGETGCHSYTCGNNEPLIQSAFKAESFVNSMGAGDAFSAMLAHGIRKGWPEQEILEKASLFASESCKIEGALPKVKSFYDLQY